MLNKRKMSVIISSLLITAQYGINAISAGSYENNTKYTTYLERFGDYFDLYRYTVTYSYENKVYTYLFKDEDSSENIKIDETYKLVKKEKLSESECLFCIKPGMYEAYIEEYQKANLEESGYHGGTLSIKNDNGEIVESVHITGKEDADKIIEERGLAAGQYEVIYTFFGGAPFYLMEPSQYYDTKSVDYLDSNWNLIGNKELDGYMFAYYPEDGFAYMRLVEETSPSKLPSVSVNYGDLDADTSVSLSDLTMLSQYLLGDIKLVDDQLKRADVNVDGEVNLQDLALLKQYVMNDNVQFGADIK